MEKLKQDAEMLAKCEKAITLLNDLVKIANDCISELQQCKDALTFETPKVAFEPAIELVPITFEEVRTRLAELSRDGKTAQVRELIAKFGATKLSEVDKKHYPYIMDYALDIINGFE